MLVQKTIQLPALFAQATLLVLFTSKFSTPWIHIILLQSAILNFKNFFTMLEEALGGISYVYNLQAQLTVGVGRRQLCLQILGPYLPKHLPTPPNTSKIKRTRRIARAASIENSKICMSLYPYLKIILFFYHTSSCYRKLCLIID